MKTKILVIDFGSQYTLVIGRTLREIGLRSAILPPSKAEKWLKQNQPKAIILSGSYHSVDDDNAPMPPLAIFEADVPILGICYGMQWLVKHFGGRITNQIANKEYGPTEARFNSTNKLFQNVNDKEKVWSSHGDSATELPRCFDIIAWSGRDEDEIPTTIAIQHKEKPIWGVQFHPEVNETPDGKKILSNFLFDIAGCEKDWLPTDIIQQIEEEIIISVGDKKVILGMSGGVDSTTLGAILARVCKDNLLGITIDTGGLRKNELLEIQRNADLAGIKIKIISAAELFHAALSDSIDAEWKRTCFKRTYATILEEEAKLFGADFIAQGSLATDIIESGATGEAQLIKSHHNVGLNLSVQELHPLRNLFKYEVRELALALDLPESIAYRQPFPGPGLYIRSVGVPASAENLEIVRWADDVVSNILKKHGVYNDISQLIVALAGLNTVGIKGDERKYGPAIFVRAVKTTDFMTAHGIYFPEHIFKEINREITKHPQIVRCMLDPTDKPPATTEFE